MNENIFTKIQKKICSKLYIDFSDNYRDTILLAGTGRSGTTWIQDIINYKNNYRIVFEPFNSRKVDLWSDFKYRQYIRPENKEKKFSIPAGLILSGRVHGKWVDSHNKKLLATKRIVKDIRINLFLKWIKKNFNELSMIFIIRHPIAVALSRQKLSWDTYLDVFLSQEDLLEDYLFEFKDQIEAAKKRNEFEKNIFHWCIENYVPLKQFAESDIYIAYYEDFCIHPEREVQKMFKYLGKEYNSKVLKKIDHPSATSRRGSAIMKGADLIKSWKNKVDEEQIKKAGDILENFGLNGLYDDVYSSKKGLLNFMSS